MDITDARKKLEDLRARERELLAAAAYVHTAISSLDRLIQAAEKINASGVKSADLDTLVKETTSLLLGIAYTVPTRQPEPVANQPVKIASTKRGRKKEKVVPPPPPPASSNGKQVRKARSTPQFGCWPFVAELFRKSFAPGTQPPATLEEAMRIAYGDEWTQRTFGAWTGPGQHEKVSFADDLLRDQSQVKRCVSQTAERLLAIKEDKVPSGRKVTDLLSKLYEELNVPDNWNIISSTLRRWGLEVV